MFRKFNISRNFPEILAKAGSYKISFSFEFAYIPGSRAENKLFFLNIMHKVKA